MKAFLLKIKDGAKKMFFSSFFAGVLVTSITCTGIFINLRDIEHTEKIIELVESTDAAMIAQEEYHKKQTEGLERRVYNTEIVNASQKQLIERASEIIFRYRAIIQQLVDELNKLNGYETPNPSRSDA
jgi:hypothetical protein